MQLAVQSVTPSLPALLKVYDRHLPLIVFSSVYSKIMHFLSLATASSSIAVIAGAAGGGGALAILLVVLLLIVLCVVCK